MFAIAIDGPAGAGKSTLSRALAQQLGYLYVDTGALYRAVGWFVLSHGKRPTDEAEVSALLPELTVELRHDSGVQQVLANGMRLGERIRTPEVSMAASAVSALPCVRRFLFDTQRQIAKHHHIVMDGRDIGTVVLPHAQVKIFLTASPEERARRRWLELTEKGIAADREAVLSEMKQRDYDDSHRAIAPLKPAEDAVLADTTGLSPDQSLQLLLTIVRQKLGGDAT